MNYEQASKKSRSEKIILSTIDSIELAKLFVADGLNYKRSVNFFVVGVSKDGVDLTKHGNTSLSVDQWYFDEVNMMLYVRTSLDPKNYDIGIKYRHFLSTTPLNLPCELSSGGQDVPWLPLISSIGALGEQLDDQAVGIVLESNTSIKLINRDGFFDNIFDKHIWENKDVYFYSWFPGTSMDEIQPLFAGVVESKTFGEDFVSFAVKDNLYKLRNTVSLPTFSALDGNILPTYLGKPKRRIYGMADTVKTISTSAILDGYNISGTISGNIGDKVILGVGTSFYAETSPGDEIYYTVGTTTYKAGIATIDSNTQITLSKEAEASFSGLTVKLKPKIPWYKKNRTWNLSGYKLFEPSVTITSVISSSAFTLSNTEGFFANDEILVNGIAVQIKNVSFNTIVTKTTVSPAPSAGMTVTKRPVINVYHGSKKMVYGRDYTYTNSTECLINIENGSSGYPAEFNLVEPQFVNIDLDFHDGTGGNPANMISTNDPVDLRTILKPRDWIKADNIAYPEYFEILDVSENQIILRTNFTHSAGKLHAYIKTPEYIDENSLITVDCLGIDDIGNWAKTAADSVKHILSEDCQFFTVNDPSFIKSNADCDYIMSLVIPEDIGNESPMVRDVINQINTSVFGALFVSRSEGISYSILNSVKPEITDQLKDDDILGFSVSTNQKIISDVKVNYRQFIDIYSGESATKTTTQTSDLVNKYVKILNKQEKTIYLYEDEKAEIMAHRILLFNSLSSLTVKIKAKMNLALVSICDKIYLSFDRLFKRFSDSQRLKLGIVTSIRRDGFGVEIEVNDMGNIFNRIPSIAPDTTPDYTSATDEDKIKWGFILDDATKTPDSTLENGLGSGIIG